MLEIWNNFQWRIQHQENKSPQIFFSPFRKKNASTEQHQNDRSDMQRCTKNKFYSVKKSSKLGAEGAIGNLMNVLHCPKNEFNQFWAIVQSPMPLILQTLGESSVPKAVLKPSGEVDSIQKSLWILCKQFKFFTTSSLRIECFKNLQKAINIQSLLFLKYIETFLWKSKLVNNCSISSKQQP